MAKHTTTRRKYFALPLRGRSDKGQLALQALFRPFDLFQRAPFQGLMEISKYMIETLHPFGS